MDQSAIIAAVVLAGFILYLAAKNRLTAYTAVLWGPTAAPLPSLGSGSPSGGSPIAPSAPNPNAPESGNGLSLNDFIDTLGLDTVVP